MTGMVATTMPNFGAATGKPIVDKRQFLGNQDYFLLGVGALLVVVLLYKITDRKTRPVRRAFRRRRIDYHKSRIAALRGGGGSRKRRRVKQIGANEMVSFGRGTKTKFGELSPSLQRQIRRAS